MSFLFSTDYPVRRFVMALIVASLLATGCAPERTTAEPGSSTAVDSSSDRVAAVASAATSFLDSLDEEQRAQAQLPLTKETVTAWSNFPCGQACRGGIGFGSLNPDQLEAAKSVLRAAMGTSTGAGFDQAMKILLADDALATAISGRGAASRAGSPLPGGFTHSGYSSRNYFLAILNEPSRDGNWQLHFGGHHLAVDIAYRDGRVTGSTPFFIGVEPTQWTAADGVTYAPLSLMRDGMLRLLGSLSPEQRAKAALPQIFTNVLLGPGKDGKFPRTKVGLRGSDLSAEQQQLVMEAVRPWIAVVDDATAAVLMAAYAAQIDDTYIAYSGSPALSSQGDYVRVDGPGIWVEMSCQSGFEMPDTVHFHTVYRDHVNDYGGEFSF